MINNLTVIIFTHNEEKNIKDCLKSAKQLTSNIIVIDSQSNDKTLSIVKKEKIPFYSFPYKFYVEPARNFGIEKANTDWVFILDADERITKELAQEIHALISTYEMEFNLTGGYNVPRKNIFLGRWLKHGGWWPDYQTRLINKKFLISWPEEIHSTPQIKGKIGFLKNPLLHWQHQSFEEMVKKTIIFEEIESQLLFQVKKKVKITTFFRKFFGELYRRLIKNIGFLDGIVGIIEAIYQAFSKTITYLFLYEKYQKGGSL
jgi:glycosyltransferase involved in cell wall biosynthesis